MKIAWFVPSLLIATQSYAGGWEASALDTGFMYKDGNYGELSYASLDYDVKATALKAPGGTVSNITEKNIVKDQNRTVFSFKTSVSDFTLGLSSFTSAAMKLNGSGSTYYSGNGTAIPSADAEISTLAFVSKYSFSENFDVLLGVNQNTLAASTATTSRGTYKISGKSGTGEIYGVAYSKPEIALRVELLAQPKAKMTTSTNYVPSAYGVATIAAALAGGDSACTVVPAGGVNFNSTLNRPETYTLNLQTGIAENTLLIGSIHKTNWSKAQIDVPTGCSASATGSKFTDTTTTKVGVGRKLSDNWSVLASYQQETGGNKTTTSLFTVNNGYQSINLGVSYTVDNITISGGYSYTDIGDVAVVIPVSGTDTTYATYKNNSASALGLKVGVSF
jgi:long-subunit fatty acid transport protein